MSAIVCLGGGHLRQVTPDGQDGVSRAQWWARPLGALPHHWAQPVDGQKMYCL